MSRDATRDRILAAARTLLEAGETDVSMSRIARAAGVSRQLLYLHFAGRAALLLAVTRSVDEEVRPTAEQQRVDSAPDARSALREAVALQGRIKPRVAAVAAAFDRLRRTDQDAAEAWREREDARYARARRVVDRIDDEGLLPDGWDAADGARLLWSATSQRAWEELVTDAGWSSEQWVRRTTEVLERALVDPTALSGPAAGRRSTRRRPG